ncbi:MAG: choice-of-anchor B family protein [Saprospiraceae bacterium]|nr:choice-of-anchor B family protein [Saprospiraceae bacterium]
MIRNCLCFCAFLLAGEMFAQDGDLNMKIVAHVPAPEGGSGIWHYVDRKGVEYAAIGTRSALVIYSLENPAQPIERYRAKGVTTTWREVFSYGDYIYGATDASSDGLIIIDMRKAPDTIRHTFWSTSVTANNQTDSINTCHTLFVDEKGILSLNGCSPWQGVLFFDLNQDPENPAYLGAETKRYCHDNFVRNDTMYSSDIYQGLLSLWDVRDPQKPVEMATITTPFQFTHNSWPSDDSRYVFTTDERENAYVAAYDISDFSDIRLVDQWRPKDTEGTGVIPHNTRYLNGYLITSYYTDGVKIVDAHRPENLIEVGSVDTYFGNQSGFHGCWGVSPYLPSGTIVASDIEGGLFVIEPEYVRACYLEGKVTDSLTNEVISKVSVIIDAPRKNAEETNLKGLYKTGYAVAGDYDVHFDHPDYFPKTITARLDHGVVTLRDVQLVKRKTIQQRVIVLEKGSLKPVEGASVRVFNSTRNVEATTGVNGEAIVSLLQDQDAYVVAAGKWAYLHASSTLDSQAPVGDITLLLENGYQDDFLFDLGWATGGSATSGKWVREIPLGTLRGNQLVQTDSDVPNDLGNECYVTGNGSSDPSGDDIDGGTVSLTSPFMDLNNYREPLLNLSVWFANSGGNNNPNDSLSLYLLTSGIIPGDTIHLLTASRNDPKWTRIEKLRIKDYLTTLTNVSLYAVAGDFDPGHLVEAALDAFLITEGQPVGSEQVYASSPIRILPTIFHNETTALRNPGETTTVHIDVLDLSGRVVERSRFETNDTSLELGESLMSGIYFVKMHDASGKRYEAIKLIKF